MKFDKRLIFEDIKHRIREGILRFSKSDYNEKIVEEERLSLQHTPHLDVRGHRIPWRLHIMIYSFTEWEEPKEHSRLYRFLLDTEELRDRYGVSPETDVLFMIVLNADLIPKWNDHHSSHVETFREKDAPSDLWCAEFEDLFKGLAHEVLYYVEHCSLAGIGLPSEASFTNPYPPGNAKDSNMICSMQGIAKSFTWFENASDSLRISTLESFTQWQQQFNYGSSQFFLYWRTEWICRECALDSAQFLFRNFDTLPRKGSGQIDEEAIRTLEESFDFNLPLVGTA
jgi:hypothetical protein